MPQEVHPQRLPQSAHGERARGNGGLEARERCPTWPSGAFHGQSVTLAVRLWPVSEHKDVYMHFFTITFSPSPSSISVQTMCLVRICIETEMEVRKDIGRFIFPT